MEDIGRCETCKYFQGLVEIPNGHTGLTKNNINCWYFGYMELMIDAETCKKYERD